MKLIIDINEEIYSDTIHDSEYDTLQLGITLKEIVKNGVPLEKEIENIKAEIRQEQWYIGVNEVNQVFEIIDEHIKENKE